MVFFEYGHLDMAQTCCLAACQRHPGSMLIAQNRHYPHALEMHLVCRYAGQLVRIGFAWRKLGHGYGYLVALVVDFFVSSAD